MKTKRSAGLSLVEVMIVSIILAAVLLMSMTALFTASNASAKGSAASDIETRGTRFLGLCRDDMSAAQYGQMTNLGSGGTLALGINPATPVACLKYHLSVAYQIPGNRGHNGQKKVGGAIIYGYNSPFNIPNEDDDGVLPILSTNHTKFYENLVCYLRFEADTVFKESASSPDAIQALDWDNPGPVRIFPPYPQLVNPSATVRPNQILKMDLNGDHDMTDTYVRGKIVKLVYTSPINPVDPLSILPVPVPHAVALAHPVGFKVDGVQMTPLLLSREVVSDMVMFRVRTEALPMAPGDFYSDWDQHDLAVTKHSQRDVLFRYVDDAGSVDAEPNPFNPQLPNESTNAKGILISVIHGDYDGTPGGFIVRKNKQLIRTRTSQASTGITPTE